MAKQLVIDWQKDGVLLAQGSARGGRVTLDQASFQPIGENEDGRHITLEEALHRAVAEVGSKGEVTVVASREAVEMRTLSIPRIDADELPDVIRFQAQRQMTSLTDNWAVDFVMLPPVEGQEMQTALVAGMSPAQLGEIERACNSAGLVIKHIGLRPLDIVRYAAETGKLDVSGATMVVCVSESKADLMILRQGQCIQVRGTRLPHEIEDACGCLKGEIRRSLMAASAHLAGESITSVLLVSSAAMADRLEPVLADAAGTTVTHIDPAITLAGDLAEQSTLVQASHRVAAAAGAIALDAADKRNYLDFKSPKQRPPKKKNTGRYILYGGAAAALVLAGIGWWYTTTSRLDRELADLRNQLASKKELLEASENKVRDWKQVEAFLDTSPNWLNELTYIAERMPPADKVIINLPTFSVDPRGVATIKFNIRTDAAETIGEFEKTLQDEQHLVRVQGNEAKELPQARDRYKWGVMETVEIKGRGWNPWQAAAKGTSATALSASTTDKPADVSANETPVADKAASSADSTRAETDVKVEGAVESDNSAAAAPEA